MGEFGVFIVFEGIDGSGKSTHIKFLSENLRARGFHVLETSEPSRDSIGTFIRRYAEKNEERVTPETEALLFAADRYEHVKQVIKPALERGMVVISDRYFYSSIAYQGATGIDIKWIREMNRFALKPELGILLDILPDCSLKRVNNRARTVFEVSDYLKKVREIYLDMVDLGELVRVEADRQIEEVRKDILKLVNELLKSRVYSL
jgi:dTMP kinase